LILDEQLKRRLVGAAVIVSLIVIFVPMLLDDSVDSEQADLAPQIPDKPKALQHELPAQEILPDPIPPAPVTNEPVAPPAVESSPAESEQMTSEPIEQARSPSRMEDSRDEGKTEAARPTPAAWLVQVGSFTQQENATKLVEKLREADFPAQLQEVTIGGKRHYRVQMLPQLDKKDAEVLIERIKKEFALTATLLRYAD
jgi:DedD protein